MPVFEALLAGLRGELSQRGFHPVHAADDGVHARRIREPNMRGASERFAGHKGHFRFLEQARSPRPWLFALVLYGPDRNPEIFGKA